MVSLQPNSRIHIILVLLATSLLVASALAVSHEAAVPAVDASSAELLRDAPSSSSDRAAQSAQSQRRTIINGQDTNSTSYRWFSTMLRSVRFYDFKTQQAKEGLSWMGCSGSLITPNWILTAAHCLQGVDINELVWRVGFRGFCPVNYHEEVNCGLEYADIKVEDIFLLEEVDIGLVRLKESVPSSIQPVNADYDGQVTASLETGDAMTVLGTGKVSMTARQGLPNVLQKAELRFDSNNEICHDHLGTEEIHSVGFICSALESMEDIENEEPDRTCYGDSGGPLLVRTSNNTDILIGVVAVGDPWCRKNVAGFTEFPYSKDRICDTICRTDGGKDGKDGGKNGMDAEDSDGTDEETAENDCPSWCGDGEDVDAASNVHVDEESGGKLLRGPSSAPSLSVTY